VIDLAKLSVCVRVCNAILVQTHSDIYWTYDTSDTTQNLHMRNTHIYMCIHRTGAEVIRYKLVSKFS